MPNHGPICSITKQFQHLHDWDWGLGQVYIRVSPPGVSKAFGDSAMSVTLVYIGHSVCCTRLVIGNALDAGVGLALSVLLCARFLSHVPSALNVPAPDMLLRTQTVLEMVNLTELPEDLRAQTLPPPPPRAVCVVTGVPSCLTFDQSRVGAMLSIFEQSAAI